MHFNRYIVASIACVMYIVSKIPLFTRPEGFSGAFLKACWPLIKHDFYSLCDQFHEGSLDLTSINDGLITLIPKTNSPETVNDYRPITLLNYCLKLITKLLANRLQCIILKIIHRN